MKQQAYVCVCACDEYKINMKMDGNSLKLQCVIQGVASEVRDISPNGPVSGYSEPALCLRRDRLSSVRQNIGHEQIVRHDIVA